jgi:hypothetical protein
MKYNTMLRLLNKVFLSLFCVTDGQGDLVSQGGRPGEGPEKKSKGGGHAPLTGVRRSLHRVLHRRRHRQEDPIHQGLRQLRRPAGAHRRDHPGVTWTASEGVIESRSGFPAG